MKKLVLLIFIISFIITNAQLTDNFDTYALGDITPQETWWSLWGSSATNAQVTNSQAFSGNNSMLVRNNQTDDVLLKLGDKSSGVWIVKWKMFIPTGATGYWNYQELQDSPGAQFNGQVFVGATTTQGQDGFISYNFTGEMSPYPNNTWFTVESVIDLNNQLISMNINGVNAFFNVPYTGTKIGAIDFYSIDINNNFFIDDITFYEPLTTCAIPTNFTSSNVTTNSIDFNWTIGGSEANWEIEYGPVGFVQGEGTIASVNTNSFTLTGLSLGTEYNAYLRANCDNTEENDSAWVGPIIFSTLVTSCPAPTGLFSSYIYTNSLEFRWTNGNTETSWEIEYGIDGFIQGTGTMVQINTNPYVLTGLNSNTTYDIYLRANCGANPGEDDSVWIGPLTFTTFTKQFPNNLYANLNESNGEVMLNWDASWNLYSENFNDGYGEYFIPHTGAWYAYDDHYIGFHNGNAISSTYINYNFSNFEMEVDLKRINGDDCSLGVYFNGNPNSMYANGEWRNTYSLVYCSDDTPSWKFEKIQNGNWITLQNWTNSEFINPGIDVWNTLKVISDNGRFDIFFNDVFHGSFYDSTFSSGKVAIKMEDYSTDGLMNVDDFSIKYIDTPLNTEGFLHYNIYRDGILIGTSTNASYVDQLPTFGMYTYLITAQYANDESIQSNSEIVVWSTNSTNDFKTYNFSYYPNPVEQTLLLKADKNIISVEVYSMLGQELITITPDNSSINVDFSELITGTYFVKVKIDNNIKTFRIIKK